MFASIKKKIPESIKGPVKAALQSSRDPEFTPLTGRKKIIVSVAGFYQNVGDMAITYAQKEFLKTHFPSYEIVLLPSTDTYLRMKALKKACSREDIITTIGGGNMDDLYVSLENARRYIIRSFPDNRIVSFPQTIAFSDTPFGQKRKKKTMKTYARHKNLAIFAREPTSLHIMQEAFPQNKLGYCPDIVLSLHESEPAYERCGVVYCIRNDAETYLTQAQRDLLKTAVADAYPEVTYTDTTCVTLEECSPRNYEQTLKKFWLLLKKSRIVLTDRLHTMIFCAVTKTPCVVLSNSNHKIKGTYEQWLKDLAYIQYLDAFDVPQIIEAMNLLSTLDLSKTSELNLTEKYEPLVQAIRGRT